MGGSPAPKEWPADKVERWSLDRVIPYDKNARTHSAEQIDQIARSMLEWGWTNPLLVDERGGLIAGHGRLMAARKLGWTEGPVMVAKGWTKAQKRATEWRPRSSLQTLITQAEQTDLVLTARVGITLPSFHIVDAAPSDCRFKSWARNHRRHTVCVQV